MQGHTADFHLVPQLSFGLLARLGLLPVARGLCTCLGRHDTALALQRDLTGMHIALRLHALTPAILGCVNDTRRRRTRNLTRPHAPRQSLCLLPLQLLQHLLDGYRIEDLLCGGGQDGEDGEGAVFLVLLEAPAQVLLCNAVLAHALPGLGELAQCILAGQVRGAEDAGANGKVSAVALEPVAR